MSSIKPKKPTVGQNALQGMYDSICQIIDYLPSLQVTGDNKTIKVDSFGSGKTVSLVKKTTNAPNSSQKSYDGPFAISTNESGGLNVLSGALNRNGEVVNVPSGVITSSNLKTGYVCVTSELKGSGSYYSWQTPKFEVLQTLSSHTFPVGYVKQTTENGETNNEITQYYIGMAFLIITKTCPLAKS